MPYNNLSDGLYLVKQPSDKLGAEHYGILDVGNVIRYPQIYNYQPIIIHQTPPRIRIDWLKDTGTWVILGKVHPRYLQQAIRRVQLTLRNPSYDLFSNNCEQFARFIAEGESYSTQLRFAGILTAALVTITSLESRKQ